MNLKARRKLILECELSSSETIMLTKGGKHTLKVPSFIFTEMNRSMDYGNEDDHFFECPWEVEVSVQMPSDQKQLFNQTFVQGFNDRKRMDEENEQ